MLIPKVIARSRAAAALADELPWWGFVDDRTALTLGGEFVTLGEVSPFSPDGADPAALDAVTQRWLRMFSALPPTARAWVYLLRRPPELACPPSGPPAAQAAQAARERHLRERVEATRVYAAWSAEGNISRAAQGRNGNASAAGFSDHLRHYWQRATAQLRDGGGEDAQAWLRASLQRECERVRLEVDGWAAMVSDVTPVRMLAADEASAVLSELVNRPGDEPLAAPRNGAPLSWWLARSPVEFHRHHAELAGQACISYSLLAPPMEICSADLAALGRLRGTVTVAMEWRPLAADAARSRIKSVQNAFAQRQYTLFAQATGGAESGRAVADAAAVADIERLGAARIELETDGVAYGELCLSVTVHGPLAEIERQDAQLKRIFAACDAKLIRERFAQPSILFGRLPGAPRSRQVRPVMASAGVAAAIAPVSQPRQGAKTCPHLGRPALAVLETPAATPYWHSLFHGDVAHTAILGSTGSGKSFLANFLLLNSLRYEPRVCILDLGGSYRGLTELAGGSYVALSAERSAAVRLAPFSLPAGERSVRFLTAWLGRLLRLGGRPPSPEDLSDIERRVAEQYELDVGDRTLGALVEALKPELRHALAPWHGDGSWAHIFDGQPRELEVADWQVVDLSGASEHDDLVEASLSFVLERLRLAIDSEDSVGRLKLLMVDEAWKFLADPQTAAWLMEAARTWRKRNAGLWIATQSASDLAASHEARALIESCPTKVFLANRAFRRDLADTFGLDVHEIDIIRGLVPKRELYLRRPDEAALLRLSVDPESYWLYTSSATDAERRSALAREHGMLGAVRLLAREGIP